MNQVYVTIPARLSLLFLICLFIPLCSHAQGPLQERIRERLRNANQVPSSKTEKINIAGLNVAVWRPVHPNGPAPLVIFSHGFHGVNTQTTFLMKALSEDGYLVMAPNHQDAFSAGNLNSKPEVSFKDVSKWNEDTYKRRGQDIYDLLVALQNDKYWKAYIDWSKLSLAGHSLGGYTVLALAGAWPSWKIPDFKAVLALSPYAQPFLSKGALNRMAVPVMYQGGTLDMGITPFVKGPNGAFAKTSSPAYFVDFTRASHFFWTNFNKDKKKQDLINHYSLAFLDKYIKGHTNVNLDEKLDGVAELEAK
jgi:predicted dienelactone hydrolase